MPEELPDTVNIPTPIKLDADTPFMYAAWGIRYRFEDGDWRVIDMPFRRKADAEDWKKRAYDKPDIQAEVVPIKRTLLMDENMNIDRQIEELED